MNSARAVILLLVLSATLTSCGEAQDVRIFTGPDVDAVRARHTAFAAALNKKDAATVAGFYDLTTLIIEPQRDEGRVYVGVELDNKTLLADPLGKVLFSYPDIEVSGDLAVSRGGCQFTRTDPETRQAKLWLGYCMHSWRRRADGSWHIGWESRNVLPMGGVR